MPAWWLPFSQSFPVSILPAPKTWGINVMAYDKCLKQWYVAAFGVMLALPWHDIRKFHLIIIGYALKRQKPVAIYPKKAFHFKPYTPLRASILHFCFFFLNFYKLLSGSFSKAAIYI